MLPRLEKFKRVALEIFFPQKCLGCGEEGKLLCRACQNSLSRISVPFCPKCGRPQTNTFLCPVCISWKTDLDGIRTPLKFEGLTRQAIHQFKYKNLRSLASPLADLLKECYLRNEIPGQILVPVPLHPRRLKERGYNQSALLALELGKLIKLPVAAEILKRTKFRLPQAKTSSVEERWKNVKQAFYCDNQKIKGAQIILIDDVTTSGATLDACATALKTAGARTVWGLVLAREI